MSMGYGLCMPRVALRGGTQPFGETMLLMVGGQSNAARRASQVTTSYDPRLKCFVGGNETTDRTDGQSVTNPFPTGWFNSLVPFTEFGKGWESLAPGIAVATPQTTETIITLTPAIGARHFRELMPGTGSWANMHNGLRLGKKLALDGGATGITNVLIIDHGEADADNIQPGGSAGDGTISVSDYQSILEQWTQYARRNVKLAQADPAADILVLGTQPCIVNGDGWRNMQNGHIAAALGASGYCLAGPRYAFLYDTDGVHIISAGKRLYAEYLGHRLQDIIAGNELPVLITSANRSGAVITLDYNTISGDLVIDTTAVPETTTSYPNSLYGFECFKVSDNSVLSISSITVLGTTLTLTLSADPGEAVRVRYAQQTWPGGNQAVTGVNSKLNRGNIRDSGGHTAVYDGSVLRNWACHQSVEVA